jgi:hypothetical protein
MSDYDERFREMSVNGENYLVEYPSITSAIPGFDTTFALIHGGNAGHSANKIAQEALDSGQSTLSKLKAVLVNTTGPICRKMAAFATNTGNSAILEKVNYSESYLNRLPINELPIKCQVIHDLLASNMDSLAKYVLTVDNAKAQQEAIDNFRSAVMGKSINKVTSAQLGTEKNKYQKQLKTSWKKMDILVDIVKETQPEFYAGYLEVRKLPSGKGQTLSVKVKAIDAATRRPVAHATLTLAPDNGTTGNPVAKRTAEKGGSNFAGLADGTYTLTLSKPGYKSQTVKLSVVSGEMASVTIVLEKA